MEGKGFLFLKDGRVFSGSFKSDKAEGPGQLLVDASRSLETAGTHQDHLAKISHCIFVVGSAAQRY